MTMPNMASIRSKNTKPELLVRKLLHSAGLRYRLHYQKLPGKPDIVLPKHKAIILVNGCFWHGHDCHIFVPPKKNSEFWFEKINKNRSRDAKRLEQYSELGWKTLVVWECALKGKTKLSQLEVSKNIEYWILYDSESTDLLGVTPRASTSISEGFVYS